ncbi:Oidioi.mRNA.OKI2018_I69.chr2.g4442.t1.cds [Oikopleura dioica]|uniref:Oidioi.mRNA.OKI2018_I69.chr2.g4442.t1.cds n=1 Tax=Oikopleura dioica TaxID=34765 RepID=A0ABN7T3Y6_OIKDI|nr:Oidioi.mRNA.OKI2018_I69.chr2.g4442.t1.cds [Oikopleura dioica]
MKIDVFFQTDQGEGVASNWTPLRTLRTNSDGRTDTAVLGDEEIRKINANADVFYKLVFFTDEYYSGREVFYRRPEMVFRIKKEQIEEHFHVPILCTPFSYSTYRGS